MVFVFFAMGVALEAVEVHRMFSSMIHYVLAPRKGDRPRSSRY